jgi:hypothetical protein
MYADYFAFYSLNENSLFGKKGSCQRKLRTSFGEEQAEKLKEIHLCVRQLLL